MKIGELLIMNRIITQEQLTLALHQQANSSQKLGEVLIEQGAITELQLAEALEFQLGIPVVKLNEATIEEEIVQLVDEEMALRLKVMPVERRAGKLRLAMIDPLHKEAIHEIQTATGMTIQPLIAIRSEMERIQKMNYGDKEHRQRWNDILSQSLQEQSNEIYLDPLENGMVVKYRIQNVLKKKETISTDKQSGLVNHIKRLAAIRTNDYRMPQDGRFIAALENEKYNVKVSTLPTTRGEQLFLRVTKRNQEIMKLSELGLADEQIQQLETAIQRQRGLVLISDESGSSRTAALYSLLKHVMKEELQISTIEDSVEQTMEGISQVEGNELGLPFSDGLRAVIRQNPDIVMVGEVKDADTAELSVRASLSDCLIIAGIRAASAAKTIKVLEEMGIDSQRIALSLSCVIQQRFVRRVCTQCAQNSPMTDKESEVYGKHELLQPDHPNGANKSVLGNFRTLVSAHFNGKLTVIRGNGCRLCNHTGYRGQIGLYEVMTIDDTLRELISQKRGFTEYEQYIKQKGHKTLLDDGLVKARAGITTLEEVLK